MTHSDSINELAAALADARKDFQSFGKGHTAKVTSMKGNYEYRYGNLPDLFDATTDALSKHGLTLSQWPDLADDRFVLVTFLLHKSGQWMRGHYPLGTYERPQEQGSAIMYAKRYAASAAIGIAADEDDDGAAAQKAVPQQAVTKSPPGFDNWLHDLAAVADTGLEELQKAWKASKADFRNFLTQHHSEDWMKLKQAAAKVPKAETVA